jgi:hypothetical protein
VRTARRDRRQSATANIGSSGVGVIPGRWSLRFRL